MIAIGGTSVAALCDVLAALQIELLLFASFWLFLGTLDELAIDLGWLWLRARGRLRERFLSRDFASAPLARRTAILIPAWQEQDVIGATVACLLRSWVQEDLIVYLGCYRNDPATVAAVMAAAAGDERLRIVVHARPGPTTKADCLNRLYSAMCDDERRSGKAFGSIVLHDAEDMVHPAALSLIDKALGDCEFVQLPVRPELQSESRWVAGHYADEFTEAHAKTMVVRDALGAAIPAAGVGCGFSRAAIADLAERRRKSGEAGPFSADCLTEDYELGLLMSGRNGRGRFVRVRDADGALVATRSYFPDSLDGAVRQKTRWLLGIAFQGWDRLGWTHGLVECWMRLRDRRGPLTAIVLAAAYALIVISALLAVARLGGWQPQVRPSDSLRTLIYIGFAGLTWRAAWRFAFTAREYGMREGLLAVLRIPLANLIAIISGRRAVVAYVRSLRGGALAWDKTPHLRHPATSAVPG